MGTSYPKPDNEKVTAHKLTFDWVRLPAGGREGDAPKLPTKAPAGLAWLPQTRKWWATLWATPQATQWREDDDQLVRLAALTDRFWRGDGTGGELNEIRQIEDRHGLNPKAMLQLRWQIVDDESIEKPEVPKGRSRKRYSHLKPVG
jgi:hypothetical protein